MKTVKKGSSKKPAGRALPAASCKKEVLGRDKPERMRDGINPRWIWHYDALIKLRDRLTEARSLQLSKVSEPLEPFSMDMADSATDEFDRDLALGELSAEQDALYEVEQAIRRIMDGSYGICEETGKPIPPARLRAVPWTRFSREVESRLEKKGEVGRAELGELRSARPPATATLERTREETETEEEESAKGEVEAESSQEREEGEEEEEQ